MKLDFSDAFKNFNLIISFIDGMFIAEINDQVAFVLYKNGEMRYWKDNDHKGDSFNFDLEKFK